MPPFRTRDTGPHLSCSVLEIEIVQNILSARKQPDFCRHLESNAESKALDTWLKAQFHEGLRGRLKSVPGGNGRLP